MPALIVAHPHAPRPILEAPPASRDSILAAWIASNADRMALREQGISVALHPLPSCLAVADRSDLVKAYAPPSLEDWARLEGVEAVHRLVDLHGAKAVQRWLRMVASINGEAL
jgi:hypothetical protein